MAVSERVFGGVIGVRDDEAKTLVLKVNEDSWTPGEMDDPMSYNEGGLFSISGRGWDITIEEGVKSLATATFWRTYVDDAIIVFPTTMEHIGQQCFMYSMVTCFVFLGGSLTVDDGGLDSVSADPYLCSIVSGGWANEETLPSPRSSGGFTIYQYSTINVDGGIKWFEEKAKKILHILNAGDDSEWGYAPGCMKDHTSTDAPWHDISSEVVKITFHQDINVVGTYAFSDFTSLKTIVFTENIAEIRDYAFNGCTAIKTFTFPDSITQTGKGVFKDCTSLTSFDLGASLTTISKEMFSGCTGLTSLSIGYGITAIREEAFSNCTGLTGTLTILDNIVSIDNDAFRGCCNLSAVHFEGEPNLNNGSFDLNGNSTAPKIYKVSSGTAWTNPTTFPEYAYTWWYYVGLDHFAHIKVGSTWKRGIPYIKVDGVWKRGAVFVKKNGSWRSGS